MRTIRRGMILVMAALSLCGAAAVAQAANYCCTCKGQTTGKTIESSSRALASGQCSLECGGFTNVTGGACAAPPAATAPTPAPAPTAAPAPPAAPAPAGAVLAYKTEDCSGDAVRITGSTARLEAGIRSFQVESGAPASAWEQSNYAGRHTEFAGPSICVSPGFDIQSIKLQ